MSFIISIIIIHNNTEFAFDTHESFLFLSLSLFGLYVVKLLGFIFCKTSIIYLPLRAIPKKLLISWSVIQKSY